MNDLLTAIEKLIIKSKGMNVIIALPSKLEYRHLAYSGTAMQSEDVRHLTYYPYAQVGDTKQDRIIVYTETGGVTGGSCWDSSDPQPYTTNDKFDLSIIEKLILDCIPDISHIAFKELFNKLVLEEDCTDRQYYGNSTDYRVAVVYLADLIESLSNSKEN